MQTDPRLPLINITETGERIAYLKTSEDLANIVTPDQYAFAIGEHAKRQTANSIYPGEMFVDLDELLSGRSVRPSNRPFANILNTSDNPSIAILYTINATDGRKREAFQNPRECVKVLMADKDCPRSHILFLRGMPTKEWITEIGSLCQTDPELFNTHLRFLWRNNLFSHPSVPCVAEPTIRLTFTTIGCRQKNVHESDQEAVDQLRMDGMKAMHTYESRLKDDVKAGDSVVRGFAALDEKYFLVEQELCVCLNYVQGHWIALVMTDAGNDLSEGPRGPWLDTDDGEFPSPWTKFLPTIQYPSRIALRTDPTDLHLGNEPQKLPQSAILQALDYANLLNPETMQLDPFYAISDLFRFYAHSEAQLLNIVEAKILSDTEFHPAPKHNATLSNLRFYMDIVETHSSRLRSTIDVVKNRGGDNWPRISKQHEDQHKRAETSAKLLQESFGYLSQRAESLLRRCHRGMELTMNDVMLAESKQAISQARAVTRLTLVAFFYIPLSFTTSFFGMNFSELGTQLSIWIWFVTSVPVLVLSVGFLYFDGARIKELTRSLLHRRES